jgi:hypothetical protein
MTTVTSKIPSAASLSEVERGSANPIGVDRLGNKYKIDVQRNPVFKADGNLIDNGDLFVKTANLGVGTAYPFSSTDLNDSVENTCCLIPKWKVNSSNVFPVGALPEEFSYKNGMEYITVPITPNATTPELSPNTKEVKILCTTGANFTENQTLKFETSLACVLNDSHFDVPTGAKMYVTFEIERFYSPEELFFESKAFANEEVLYTIGTETVDVQKSTGSVVSGAKEEAWKQKIDISKTFDLPALQTDEDVGNGRFFWFLNIKIAFDPEVVSSSAKTDAYYTGANSVYLDTCLLIGKTKLYTENYSTNWIIESERWNQGWNYKTYDTWHYYLDNSTDSTMNFVPEGNYSSCFGMPIINYGVSFGDGIDTKYANTCLLFNDSAPYAQGGVLQNISLFFGSSLRKAVGFVDSTIDQQAIRVHKMPMLNCDLHVFPFWGDMGNVRSVYKGFFEYNGLI